MFHWLVSHSPIPKLLHYLCFCSYYAGKWLSNVRNIFDQFTAFVCTFQQKFIDVIGSRRLYDGIKNGIESMKIFFVRINFMLAFVGVAVVIGTGGDCFN